MISLTPCREIKNTVRRKLTRFDGNLPRVFSSIVPGCISKRKDGTGATGIFNSKFRRRPPSGVTLQEVDFVELPADISAAMDSAGTIFALDGNTAGWRATREAVRNAIAERDIEVVDTPELLSQMISSALELYIGQPNSFRTRQHIVSTIENELNALASLEIIRPNPRVTVESTNNENGHIDLRIDISLMDGRVLNMTTRVNL